MVRPRETNVDERNPKRDEFNILETVKVREIKLGRSSRKRFVYRLLMGKPRKNSSEIFLAESDGSPKMMTWVDERRYPTIRTFNEKGELYHSK